MFQIYRKIEEINEKNTPGFFVFPLFEKDNEWNKDQLAKLYVRP